MVFEQVGDPKNDKEGKIQTWIKMEWIKSVSNQLSWCAATFQEKCQYPKQQVVVMVASHHW